MTRRERLEARAEKREEWAGARNRKAATAFAASSMSEARTGIPFGQPILAGHHSAPRHIRTVQRAEAAGFRGLDHHRKAEAHASAADGIRRALKRSIFSDDANAIEALREKIAKLEAHAEKANAFNAAWRRAMKAHAGDIDAAAADVCTAFGFQAATRDKLAADAKRFECSARRGPMSATHERAEARRCRARIYEIDKQADASAATAAAGGVLVTRTDGWASVRFSEKPDREVLDALRSAGFRFGAGRWVGALAMLPACVCQLETESSTA